MDDILPRQEFGILIKRDGLAEVLPFFIEFLATDNLVDDLSNDGITFGYSSLILNDMNSGRAFDPFFVFLSADTVCERGRY